RLMAPAVLFSLILNSILIAPLYAAPPVPEVSISESKSIDNEDINNESADSAAETQLNISSQKQSFTIGILTQTLPDSIKNSPWQFSFERLNKHSEYHFNPLFLSIEQLSSALENDELDFVICDAINYLVLEKEYGLLRLLTRSVQYSDSFITAEGLSVYTLDNNSHITRLQDLKDKNIGVIDNNSSISWLFLEKFLFKHGLIANTNITLNPITDINQSLVLLQSGSFDAIISKSGFIDKYITQESIESLRLINPRHGWQTPFLHSSVLIPEWPLAKAWFIDNELAGQVVSLLLNQHNSNSNESNSYFLPQYYWGIAQNYSSLNKLFYFSDQLAEKSNIKQNSFSKKIQYWISFIIICFLVIILIMYLRSSRDLNNRLTASKESLEQEIKERQHAQEQALNHQAELAHVARLSTMGEMASGLAHELNQPLSAIQTYVQGCIRRINMGNDDLDAIVNALKLTVQQADRAGGIIRRLRSFVRKGESHKTYSEINQIVHEVTGFLETQFNNKQVDLTLDLEEDLPPVLADIIQIEQVLINLLKNAIEAMSNIEKPVIIVSTRHSNHKNIELCVIDSGHGISEDKLKRIFNPFFTTKTSGMGMGLSISSSIIEAHDGKLYAENNTGQGARFCLTLPFTEEQAGNNNE
ncbi:MAG: PhnD/SsuA/transferrin family substrate-binding protein, partial [Gammaproteobacteria bacterium]|nr:PhnD/SsuA/transferrin family substrate-binding protein [Gammaproteobacteria bacterium]